MSTQYMAHNVSAIDFLYFESKVSKFVFSAEIVLNMSEFELLIQTNDTVKVMVLIK